MTLPNRWLSITRVFIFKALQAALRWPTCVDDLLQKKIPPDLKDLRQELGDLSTHLLVDRLAFDRVDEVLSNQFYIDDLVAKPLGPLPH